MKRKKDIAKNKENVDTIKEEMVFLKGDQEDTREILEAMKKKVDSQERELESLKSK